MHGRHAPDYVIADHFFQAAFGGSFLNHQYLVSARAPIDTAGQGDHLGSHSIVDVNGMPISYPLYLVDPATPVRDAQLTQACPSAIEGLACGDYAVNTMQPA